MQTTTAIPMPMSIPTTAPTPMQCKMAPVVHCNLNTVTSVYTSTADSDSETLLGRTDVEYPVTTTDYDISDIAIRVQLDKHILTASSLLFSAQTLSLASGTKSPALLVKLSRSTLPQLAANPHPDQVQRILARALSLHSADIQKQHDAAVAAAAAAKRSHSSSLTNLLLASQSVNSLPLPLSSPCQSNGNGHTAVNDDDAIPLDTESQIFANLVASISSKYANPAAKLAHLVLPLATLAHGHVLLLPRHRPLQPDFRTPQLPLVEVARLATHLVHALATMHAAGYVHCDVSNNNIVIACSLCDKELANAGFGGDSSSIPRCPHVSLASPPPSDASPRNATQEQHPRRIYRLIDFGLAQKIEDAAAVSMVCGTPGFTAPEAFACNQVPAPPPSSVPLLSGSGVGGGVMADMSLYAPFPRSTSAKHLPKSSSHLHMASNMSATGEVTHTGVPTPTRSAPIPILPSGSGHQYHPAAHSPLRPSGFSTSHLSSSYLSHSSSYDNLSRLGSCSLDSLPLLATSSAAQPTTLTDSTPNIRDAHSWTSLHARITASRDLYSLGVVVGLILSTYLPLCDADHLGSPQATPDYVAAHIKPRLLALRAILRAAPEGRTLNVALYPPDGLLVLAWAVDFVLRCLAHAPKRRPTAKRLLTRHPLCTWVRAAGIGTGGIVVPEWLQEAAKWKRTREYAAVKEAMEDRRREWEVPAASGPDDDDDGDDDDGNRRRVDDLEVDLSGDFDDDVDEDHGLVISVANEFV